MCAPMIACAQSSLDRFIRFCKARRFACHTDHGMCDVRSNWPHLCDACDQGWIKNQGPDLQNILRQSYDYLTIVPKLRSIYDRSLMYKTSYNE